MPNWIRCSRLLVALSACLAFAGAAAPALAQPAFPDRPIKLIVPFAPGGVFDAIGRPLADQLKAHLGSVVVENVAGAGGSRGVTMAARASPDGYTLLLGGNAGFIITPIAARRPLYDPVADFQPIARIATVGLSIVAHPSLPATDLAGVVAYAKANPGKLSYGTPGAGTTNHFVGEMLKALSGRPELVHVPYSGAGPALNDLIGGHIPLVIVNTTGQVIELHKAAKARILAVTTPRRLAVLPDVPTAEEAGAKSLVAEVFFGLFAPKGTPASIMERIAVATNKALAEPELRELYGKVGFETELESSPARLRAFLAAEITRWRPVIEATGYKID